MMLVVFLVVRVLLFIRYFCDGNIVFIFIVDNKKKFGWCNWGIRECGYLWLFDWILVVIEEVIENFLNMKCFIISRSEGVGDLV